jgi:hypothetical protein
MTEKQIDIIHERLGTKEKGALRGMFYNKKGLPKQGLYNNTQILEKLGILDLEINSLEKSAIEEILRRSLAFLRKEAKESKLAWVDIVISGRQASHGFSADIDKIMKNADSFDKRAKQHSIIAKETRKIAEIQKKLLSA